MKNNFNSRLISKGFSRGVTLIEMMVAILVLSIGMLGIAGLQAATSKYKINTWARSSASTLVSGLTERIRINSDSAVLGESFLPGTDGLTPAYLIEDDWDAQQAATLAISKYCESTVCSPSERATYDLLLWRQQVRASMPRGAAMLSGDAKNGFKVTMMWLDKENLVDPDSTDENPALKAAETCKSDDTGMRNQKCCPAEASVKEGVRCARFTFFP